MKNAWLSLMTLSTRTAHACAGRIKRRTILLLALCLLIGLAGSLQYSYSFGPIDGLRALEARAKALSEYTKSPAWAQLIRDYDAWAKQYGARVEMRSATWGSGRGPLGGQGGYHSCPPVDQCGPNCYCVLVRDEDGKCVYKCQIGAFK